MARRARASSGLRKADLIRRVTAAVVESLAVRPDQVRVLLYELPDDHWAVGGQSLAARREATREEEPS